MFKTRNVYETNQTCENRNLFDLRFTLYTDSLQGLVAQADWEVITAGQTEPVPQFRS
jgi:hypothetical protein